MRYNGSSNGGGRKSTFFETESRWSLELLLKLKDLIVALCWSTRPRAVRNELAAEFANPITAMLSTVEKEVERCIDDQLVSIHFSGHNL
jgi:hypothetical protein